MFGNLRNTMRRTLVLTSLAALAITAAAAAGLMVQGAQVNGSTVVVCLSNASSQPVTGTIQAVVKVQGAKETLSSPVALAPGQSALVSMQASGPIGGVITLGATQDAPVPF